MDTLEEFSERATAALGCAWRQRLALALLCSEARFKRPPQPMILAIVELIECLGTSGVRQDSFPARWRGIPALEPAELKARFARIFGADRLTGKIAGFLELDPCTVRLNWSERCSSARSTTELAAIVELLELLTEATIERGKWPKRWTNEPRFRAKRAQRKLLVREQVDGPALGAPS